MQFNVIRLARLMIATLSAVLTIVAVWLLLIELMRPNLPSDFDNPEAAQTLAEHQTTSGIAALVGLIRGRLWTEHALTFAPFLINKHTNAPDQSAVHLGLARDAAMHAVHFSPLDARAWLVIAQADSALGDRDSAPALKMTYYVAPNEESMFPLRLAIAIQSNALADPELRSLLGDEMQRILATHLAFKPDIIAAYRGASSEGKRFVEQEVARSDQDLLSALRAENVH
jgi:hypothetical protein